MSRAEIVTTATEGVEVLIPLARILRAEPGSPRHDALAVSVGRKALSLADLANAGLPVPEAFVVTTAAYVAALGSAEVAAAIASGAAASVIGDALRDAELPGPLADAIVSAWRELGSPAVAVRSSGTAEDLEGASFAGQYDTILDVRDAAALLRAVRACWASAWSDRVDAYVARKGLPRDGLGMAVVVQRLVDAEVSGVLFTLDPTSGVDEHLHAEACFGLGEALVGGKVTPDRFTLDRASGRIVRRVIASKQVRACRSPEGVVEVEVGEPEASRPTLDAAQLAELTRLGRRVQALYGRPQDIEWVWAEGRFFLVQSRPITTVAFTGIEGEWSTADFKDGGVSARVCSPFMWSLYETIWSTSLPGYLRDLHLLRDQDHVQWGRVFYGRPYWNLTEVKASARRIPGFDEKKFYGDLGVGDTVSEDREVVPFTLRTIARVLPTAIASMRYGKRRIQADQALVAGFPERVGRYEVHPDHLGRDARVARFERLIREDYTFVETGYFSTIFHTTTVRADFNDALEGVNARLDPPLSLLVLISGLQEMRHLAPLHELWAFAREVRQQPEVRATVEAEAPEALAAALRERHPALWDRVADFLRRFRHHGVAELDLTAPRWDEDPTFVMATLKAYVAHFDPDRDPAVMERRQHAAYVAERARAEAWFARRPIFGRFARRSFLQKLDLLRTYCWWREEVRDASSRMYALIRREALSIGRLHVAEGTLEAAEDLWYLTWQEAVDLGKGALSGEQARALVSARREYNAGWTRFTNPDELGARFSGRPAAPPAVDGALKGTPCSPGVVEATVRIIATIEDGARLRPGDILVTRFTDPGWTPLFSSIAGVVTETGGVLSHAAVIAREYGIPAVLAVPGARASLRDGQRVRLDGHHGLVTPLEPAS